MDNVIILRYGELFLKGKNRGFFERTLIKNIKDKIQVKNYNELMESVAPIMEIAENHTKYRVKIRKSTFWKK